MHRAFGEQRKDDLTFLKRSLWGQISQKKRRWGCAWEDGWEWTGGPVRGEKDHDRCHRENTRGAEPDGRGTQARLGVTLGGLVSI